MNYQKTVEVSSKFKSNHIIHTNVTDKTLTDSINVDDDAIKRYNDRKQKTYENLQTLAKGNPEAILNLDTQERVERRIIQLKEDLPDLTIERVIGGNDLMPIFYLEKGKRVSECACRIEVIDEMDNILGHGTGFMVSPSLLMTNNHVLRNPASSKKSLAQFNYEKGENNRSKPMVEFRLDPNKFFYTNKELDFTLVYVNPTSEDGQMLSKFHYLKLIKETGKAIIGEYVSIIQHPRAEMKQVSLRENRVIGILDDYVHSITDTSPGSSGSPVFNDQWNVVSLHHSGVPKTDDQGNYLTKDNKIWTQDMGDDMIDWIANESVRISSIIKHLEDVKEQIPAQMKPILDEFLKLTGQV